MRFKTKATIRNFLKARFQCSHFRGWHWANYSTTLGAAIHEIGHSLDLAHTPRGIMCRGHDDMNFFYTQVKGEWFD